MHPHASLSHNAKPRIYWTKVSTDTFASGAALRLKATDQRAKDWGPRQLAAEAFRCETREDTTDTFGSIDTFVQWTPVRRSALITAGSGRTPFQLRVRAQTRMAEGPTRRSVTGDRRGVAAHEEKETSIGGVQRIIGHSVAVTASRLFHGASSSAMCRHGVFSPGCS